MKILMALANGFEEIEAIAVVDILRRAGLEVLTFSITNSKNVKGAHSIEIVADELFENISFENHNMLILPGGMPGTTNLLGHERLKEVITSFAKQEKWLGAICAAPIVLGSIDLVTNKKVTCYPGFESSLKDSHVLSDNVVIDGKIITSRGPGTALQFGLKIIESLIGKEKSSEIQKEMLID